MRVTYTDGTIIDIYYGLEGGTGDVVTLWIKKPRACGIQILKERRWLNEPETVTK